ncbi:MAG TPA: LmeA family phospholipid-binding protein [Burkholderiales bacterium]|nr:LmeA family phospholipid-binding protein [Burkholderiales bacterium]
MRFIRLLAADPIPPGPNPGPDTPQPPSEPGKPEPPQPGPPRPVPRPPIIDPPPGQPAKPPIIAVRSLRSAGAVAAVIALGACASVLENRVEQTLLSELPRLVGPAAHYHVQVTGVSRAEGAVERVRAVGERVQRPKSPVLDRIEVELQGVRVARDEKKLVGLAGSEATVRVLASDVAQFLEQHRNLESVSVNFSAPEQIRVVARPVLMGIRLPEAALIRVWGRLVVHGPQLRLYVSESRLGGFPVGRLPTYALEWVINPLVDLSALPVPAEITGVRIGDDTLLLSAAGSELGVDRIAKDERAAVQD